MRKRSSETFRESDLILETIAESFPETYKHCRKLCSLLRVVLWALLLVWQSVSESTYVVKIWQRRSGQQYLFGGKETNQNAMTTPWRKSGYLALRSTDGCCATFPGPDTCWRQNQVRILGKERKSPTVAWNSHFHRPRRGTLCWFGTQKGGHNEQGSESPECYRSRHATSCHQVLVWRLGLYEGQEAEVCQQFATTKCTAKTETWYVPCNLSFLTTTAYILYICTIRCSTIKFCIFV